MQRLQSIQEIRTTLHCPALRRPILMGLELQLATQSSRCFHHLSTSLSSSKTMKLTAKSFTSSLANEEAPETEDATSTSGASFLVKGRRRRGESQQKEQHKLIMELQAQVDQLAGSQLRAAGAALSKAIPQHHDLKFAIVLSSALGSTNAEDKESKQQVASTTCKLNFLFKKHTEDEDSQ